MVPLLLAGLALARPYVGVSLGPAALTGETPQASFTSVAPMGAINWTWSFGPFEAWAGGSACGLLSYIDGEVLPAAAIEAEFGGGFGGDWLSAGVYGGAGWPAGVFGAYGRLDVTQSERAHHMGLEARLFVPQVGADGFAGALMVRMEPASRDHRRPPPPPRPPPPASSPPPERPAEPLPLALPYDDPPPTPPPVLPYEDPPPAPPPEDDGAHHEEPY